MLIRSLFLICLFLTTSVVFAAPVNINSANADTIAKSLSGVGPSKAAAIVEFRKSNGPFKTVDELKYVKGIGSKIIDKIKQDVVIASEAN